MKSTIIASLFCMDNFWPILLGLLGAALLGWLLKQFLSGGSSSTTDSSWETKHNALQAQLDAEKQKNQKLSSEAKNKKPKTDSYSVAAPIASNNAEVESLQIKLKSLREEAKAHSEKLLSVEAEKNAAVLKAKEATTINSDLETAKTRIEGLNRALEIAKADAEKYKSEMESIGSERSRLSTQLTTSDVGAMQKRIDKLESDLDSARMTNSNLQLDLDRAKNAPRSVTMVPKKEGEVIRAAGSTEADKEVAVLKATNNILQQQVDNQKLAIVAAVNASNAKLNGEIMDLRTQLKYAETRVNKLEEDKTKLAMAMISTNATSSKPAEAKVEEVTATPAPVVAEAAPVAEPVAEVKKDDLTVVEGIGPKIAELIQADGINTYAQLADAPTSRLQTILDNAGERFRVHNPGTWAEQSALLRDGKMEEFKALCDELDGGVRVDKAAIAAAKAQEEADRAAAELAEAKVNPSDLKVVEGIGPVLEKILNEGGVYTFSQLASMEASAVKAILEASGDILHNPATWPQQAALLRDGKMEEFKELTDRLKGGLE